MKILSKFKIILLAMTSIVSIGSISIVVNSCGHKKTSPPKLTFKKFSDDAQKATPFDIVSNATPKIWTTATPSQLSATPTGFQVKENVSISIELIFAYNGITKHNSFSILYKNQAYNITQWQTDQEGDFNIYKTAAEKGGAAKVWGTIYNYYDTNKKYLPNINFTTPKNTIYKPNLTIISTKFITNSDNHTIDLQVSIMQNPINFPSFSYTINIIATWSGRAFSINDWTYNYDFATYSTTASNYFKTQLAARSLIQNSTSHILVKKDIGIKVTVDKTKKVVDVIYSYHLDTDSSSAPARKVSFEAKIVIDDSQHLGLFGYNKMYAGKKSDNIVGDIHWIPPYSKF